MDDTPAPDRMRAVEARFLSLPVDADAAAVRAGVERLRAHLAEARSREHDDVVTVSMYAMLVGRSDSSGSHTPPPPRRGPAPSRGAARFHPVPSSTMLLRWMDGAARKAVGSRRTSARRCRALAPAPVRLILPRAAAAQTEYELATRRIVLERATAECIRDVEHDAAVPHRPALLTTCHELESSARARIGDLVVHAPEAPLSGLRVTIRGAALNPALLGIPNVVSPGPLTIEASASERLPFVANRVVEAGATVEVTLDLSPAAVAPPVVEPTPRVTSPVIAAPPTFGGVALGLPGRFV
jgi:hypothetical protein